mgnify:CR=1 FL=1
MKAYWISFWMKPGELPNWEYHGPWWITGEDADGRQSICAAVMANDEPGAKWVIRAAHDTKKSPAEWRFCEEQAPDWNPLANVSGRFPPKKWMKWPPPTVRASDSGGSNGG